MKKKEVQENKVFTICNLNKRKEFSTDEAKELLPLLNTITSKAKLDLSRLNAQVNMAKKYSKKVQETQEKIDEALQSWSDKVRRLGVVPVALGKVRFLCDDEDWLLWEFPSKVLMSL